MPHRSTDSLSFTTTLPRVYEGEKKEEKGKNVKGKNEKKEKNVRGKKGKREKCEGEKG